MYQKTTILSNLPGCAIDLHRDSSASVFEPLIGVCYSCLFELLSGGTRSEEVFVSSQALNWPCMLASTCSESTCSYSLKSGNENLSQSRPSLLARKDLELETQVASELLKETSELRRPSQSLESNCRTSNSTNAGRSSAAESTAGIVGAGGLIGGPTSDVRDTPTPCPVCASSDLYYEPDDCVSILFADLLASPKCLPINRLMSLVGGSMRSSYL
uniref:Uncharacterized protein n=1 Tax=Ditylenchus dipsaci TaxID=166011 RepID=A0A915DNK0_9BILA